MERNIHIDEFDEFLKKKADEYKMYPSDRVWNNINRSVHTRFKWTYISLTLLFLFGSVVYVERFHDASLINNNRLAMEMNSPDRMMSSFSMHSAANNVNPPSALSLDTGYDGEKDAITLEPEKKLSVNRLPASHLLNTLTEETLEEENYSDEGAVAVTNNEQMPAVHYPVSPIDKQPDSDLIKEEENGEQNVKKVLWGGEVFRKSRFEWQLFLSPTVSYRRLTSGLSEIKEVFRGVPYSTTNESNSVNNMVTHKPAIGAEVGANLIYKLSDHFILRTGLQLNYSRYQLRAFPAKPELTTLAVLEKPTGISDSINAVSTLQNFSGSGSSWFDNEFYQVSMPVGFEWGVLGNSYFQWNIAASAQPVFNFANNAYLLSTDFRRYAQDPSLIRKWNLNAGIETYVSYNMGSFRWQAGPQFRYQLMSSYKSEYPVKEYLMDFGFKIGVTKTIR